MMLVPSVASTFLSPRSPPLCPFRFAARVLREGLQGTIFIVPRTPFRMAACAML